MGPGGSASIIGWADDGGNVKFSPACSRRWNGKEYNSIRVDLAVDYGPGVVSFLLVIELARHPNAYHRSSRSVQMNDECVLRYRRNAALTASLIIQPAASWLQ